MIIILSSCRKGEEDPRISLRSRNQRLEGVWKMKYCNGYIDLYEDNYRNRWFQSLFDPELIKGYRFSYGMYSTGYYAKYEDLSCNIGFSKDGKTTFNIISPELKYSSTGTWCWENDIDKRKEYIYITDLNIFLNCLIVEMCDTYSVFSLKEDMKDYEDLKFLQIKKLSNKEIIFFTSAHKQVAPEKGYDKISIQFEIILSKE